MRVCHITLSGVSVVVMGKMSLLTTIKTTRYNRIEFLKKTEYILIGWHQTYEISMLRERELYSCIIQIGMRQFFLH